LTNSRYCNRSAMNASQALETPHDFVLFRPSPTAI
jgi:hypothetical protein